MEVGVIHYSKVQVLDTNGNITEAHYSLPPLKAIQCAVNQMVYSIWLADNHKEIKLIETDHSYMHHSSKYSIWVRK